MGSLGPGDVQWMTAAGGIVHSEMPSRRIMTEGGRVHGLQIWVNLPARLKMGRPRYQEVPSARIPRAATPDGKARVRVVAGEALGVRAAIETHTPIVFQDWTLDAGADVAIPIPRDHQVLLYVFEGVAHVGARRSALRDGQLAILAVGDVVHLRGPDEGSPLGCCCSPELRSPSPWRATDRSS
jgi:redox-sensitive bicupin YhaK (pirin superfamily)